MASVHLLSFLLIHYTRRGGSIGQRRSWQDFLWITSPADSKPPDSAHEKTWTGFIQKKKAVGLLTAFSFCSCFQDISIKYGMIVFQNLMISFSSIAYGCSCTCSCQKQDPCPKHWICIVSKWWFWHDFLRKRLTLTPKTETLSVKISGSSVFTENVSCIYFESPHTEFK